MYLVIKRVRRERGEKRKEKSEERGESRETREERECNQIAKARERAKAGGDPLLPPLCVSETNKNSC
jgi:hypothetical protein